ncbi:hypothetical protein B0H17DRAFT_1204985 [Mycena rosella]|uniref:Uncharacterized protein n=1 Tax=Mycena rosella TaxID=1033263 RepID=A0AAD7D8A1_MYCRO|nr:hypothetical protein B0H17DRAFT_1204985 [Mycena rosella]
MDYSEGVITLPLLGLLGAVSNRWQQIEFTTPQHYRTDWFSRPLSTLSPADVPKLTNVKFGSQNPTLLRSPFLAASTISRISISYIPQDVETISISWHLLTRLDLGSADQDDLWAGQRTLLILGRCANLEVCSLVITRCDPSLITDDTVALPHLTSLSIICHDHIVGGLIAQRLVLPELTSLKVSEPFGAMLFRIFFPALKLRALAIDGLFMNFSLMMGMYTPLPRSLEILDIASTAHEYEGNAVFDIDDMYLQTLITDHFPRLKTLKLYGCSEITDAGLLSYITTHAHSGNPLQSVNIAFLRPMQQDILPDLADLISAGLRISLRYNLERWENDSPPYRPWEGTDLGD